MAERDSGNRRTRQLPNDETYGSGQAEQYDDSSYEQNFDSDQRSRGYGSQMGERSGSRPGGYYPEESTMRHGRERGRESFGDYRDSSGLGDRDTGRSRSNFDNSYDRGFADRGGRSFERGRERGGTYLDDDHMSYDERRGSRDYRRFDNRSSGYRDERGHDRGFFEKAGDQIASWFGDEEASRRVRQDHRGSGPSNYTRSDQRILEDACDTLTEDWEVDARNIQVTVKEGEVTLDGTVSDRGAKRRAEDCVHDVSGVKHVQNNLRVQNRIDETTDYSARETDAGKI